MASPASTAPRRLAGLLARPFRGGFALAMALTVLAPLATQTAAQAGGGVTITSYGHSALLINGGGLSVLLNPFKAVGCAAGLPEPRVAATVVLASSLLRDEGGGGGARLLTQPGSYRLAGLQLEGIGLAHDRVGGRRFGQSTAWRWKQGGLVIAHLGGTAGRLSEADRVLLGRPDVLIIGVGGGAKVYDGSEAAEVVRELSPRRVIPVQYTTGKAPAGCDQGPVEPFLKAMAGTPVQRPGNSLTLPGKLSDGLVIEVLR